MTNLYNFVNQNIELIYFGRFLLEEKGAVICEKKL